MALYDEFEQDSGLVGYGMRLACSTGQEFQITSYCMVNFLHFCCKILLDAWKT